MNGRGLRQLVRKQSLLDFGSQQEFAPQPLLFHDTIRQAAILH
jgi:hypothetical protein